MGHNNKIITKDWKQLGSTPLNEHRMASSDICWPTRNRIGLMETDHDSTPSQGVHFGHGRYCYDRDRTHKAQKSGKQGTTQDWAYGTRTIDWTGNVGLGIRETQCQTRPGTQD